MLFDSLGDYVFLDGAMGTMLQSLLKGSLKPGSNPAVLSVAEPSAVESIHRMYAEAGSGILCANTFGANADMLRGTGYSPKDIITAAVSAARRGAESAICADGGAAKVALDIGPTGRLLAPLGDLGPEAAYGLFKEMAEAGEEAGADLALIETMGDLAEAEAALRAVNENTSLPAFVCMTFEKNGFTYMGCPAERFAESMRRLGAAAAGLNCSREPADMLAVAERIAKSSGLPLIVKLNAGLPDPETGLYGVGPAEFSRQMLPYKKIGAKIVGGCCGTTPEHIRELRKAFSNNRKIPGEVRRR